VISAEVHFIRSTGGYNYWTIKEMIKYESYKFHKSQRKAERTKLQRKVERTH
jgi:hypothetical protein